MKYYDMTFFCDLKGPTVHLSLLSQDQMWPITVRINADTERQYASPSITLHLDNERQLINFKNSVIATHEKYLREVRR